MGGAATPPCRGSTLGKPRLQELNLPMGCSLVAWKLNSYFYAPKLVSDTREARKRQPRSRGLLE
jgi:hypothetical protein